MMVKINLKTLIALFSVCCFFMPQSVMAQSAEDKKFVEKLYNSLDNIEARDSIISRLTRILEGNARFHKARFILAYLLEKKGFENLAIDAYKICIKQDPENFQYHYQLLLIAIRSLNNSLIFEELASLKRLSQDDGEKLLRLAFVMDNANYTSVATGLFEEAVKARKNSKAIAYRIARYKFDQGFYKEARKYLRYEIDKGSRSKEIETLQKQILQRLNETR